jgi:hypothetical protein
MFTQLRLRSVVPPFTKFVVNKYKVGSLSEIQMGNSSSRKSVLPLMTLPESSASSSDNAGAGSGKASEWAIANRAGFNLRAIRWMKLTQVMASRDAGKTSSSLLGEQHY